MKLSATRRNAGAFLAAAVLSGAVLKAQVGFTDESARLSFVHGGGLGGACWLDYDADGDLDLFLPNAASGRSHGLFRNNGDGTFSDVTVAANVAGGQGGAGAVAADIDNDGYPDLFVTGSGGVLGSTQSTTRLWHNQRNGSFADISATAGVPGAETALGAAFGDVDLDGFVDLFVCSPGSLATRTQHRNKLYRNNGDLTFTDVSSTARVDTALGAVAAVFTDFDLDGAPDILVANGNDVNQQPSRLQLFRNDGTGRFTDVAANVGLTALGHWRSVAIGDIDADGDLDLFAANSGAAAGRPHALYRRQADGTWLDVAASAGLASSEIALGSTLRDFDNDGDADLFVAGSLAPPPFNIIGPGLGNPGRLFTSDGAGTFTHAAGAVPVDMSSDFTSGVASADWDGDGSTDVVVVRDDHGGRPGRPALLRGRPSGNHWITLRLVGTTSNRMAIGARIELFSESVRGLYEVRAGGSFASCESPWPTIGLGARTQATLRVTWPSGRVEVFPNQPIDRTVTLVEGSGGLPATFTTFGAGCAGTVGVPRMQAQAGSAPWINSVFYTEILNIPPAAPVAVNVGLSNTQWGQTRLPFDLGIFGAPGCSLLTSVEYWTPLGNLGGHSLWAVLIPDVPTLVGAVYYTQATVWDPGANTPGIILSNGGCARIGSP